MTSKATVLVILHDIDGNLNEMAMPLADAGLMIDTWDVVHDHDNRPKLDELDKYAGVISLGAQAGVLEEAENEWMSHERKIMQWCLETETPLLGLCFGSQLLASAAGARVYVADKGEFGWTKLNLTEDAKSDPVIGVLKPNANAFHYHYDTFELPENAVLLAETDGMNEAYRVGRNAWATQFHPEVGLSAQLSWLSSYRRSFEKRGINVDEQIKQSHENAKSYRQQAWDLSAAFAEQVLKNQR